MYSGYLSFGGTEIVNGPRAYGYTRTLEAPITWLRCESCPSLAEALGESEFTAESIESAPWYDENDPRSWRFYGVFPVDISGVEDSTREVSVLEGLLDGGVVSGVRRATKEVRVRAMLVASGEDALEFGMAWLTTALEPSACSVHGSCGEVDLQFFGSCPPSRSDVPGFYTDWELEDINLATNPSFEATSGTVEVRRNLALNPALRDDSNGWGDRIVTGVRTAESAGAFDWAWTATGDASTLDVNSRLNYSLTGLTIGETYTVSAWVRATNGGGWDFRGDQGANGPTIPGAPGTPFPQDGEWHRVSVTFDAVGTEQWVGIRGGTSGLTGVYDVGITGLLWEVSPTLGPYFDGSTQPAVRENLLNTPNGAFGASGEFGGRFGADQSVETTDPPPGVSQYRRGVATQNNPVGWDFYANPQVIGTATTTFPVTAGETVTFSAWVRSNKTGNIRINYKVYDGVGAWIQDENVFVPLEVTDTWQEAVFHLPITETGYLASFLQNNGTDVTGDYLDAVVCVERGAQTGGYFDGGTAPADGFAYGWRGDPNESTSFMYDTDFSTSWEGAENASESVLTGERIPGRNSYASTHWTQSGMYSAYVPPYASTDSFINIADALGSSPAGKMYTIMGTIHFEEAMPGASAGNARGFRVVATTPAGNEDVSMVGDPAPNTPGTHVVRQTFTVPQDATAVPFVRAMNGTAPSGPGVWWDDVLIVEGEYDGPYFDGSTVGDDYNRYEWDTGEEGENSSPSLHYTREDREPDDEEYGEFLRGYTRYLHDVTTSSGPIQLQEYRRSDGCGGMVNVREVEFNMIAGTPFVYGLPREVGSWNPVPTVTQDTPYNLVPYPSAELAAGSVVVATNYSTNPSVEVDATDWSGEASAAAGAAPSVAFSRSSDVAAAGAYSYRGRLTGSGASSNKALISLIHEVDISAMPSGSNFSVSMWSGGFVTAGNGSFDYITVIMRTLDSGGAELDYQVLGDGLGEDIEGSVYSLSSFEPHPDAVTVTLTAFAPVNWPGGANTISLYADAALVSVP